MTLLTIILPNYDYLDGYRKNLHQITNQKYVKPNNVRILISDDSSSSLIEDHFKENYILNENMCFIHGPRSGAVSNWNQCIESSETSYSMILHHDEYIMSDKFLKCLLNILTNDDADVIILPLIKKSKGKYYKHYPVFLKWLYVYFPSLLFACNAFGSPSVVVYRTNINEKYDEKLKWFVDVDWYYRLLSRGLKVRLISNKHLTIISDLDFDNTESKKMGPEKLSPVEKLYLKRKYGLPKIIYSRAMKPLQFPVKIYKLFGLKDIK